MCENPIIVERAERREGGLHRAERAWERMTTREAWPQAQAQMSESVGGGRHAEQATHASRHCNQNTLADKLKGDTRAGRGGWVDPGDEASGVSAQDMSEQGSTGDRRRVDQPERVAGGVGRLHEDLRRTNLETTASCRKWLDLVRCSRVLAGSRVLRNKVASPTSSSSSSLGP